MNNFNLMKAVVRLDSEEVNTELGKVPFIYVTTIDEIGKFFGVNLNNIDKEFQELKDTKYKYEEFCDLADDGKVDEYKPLDQVFEYLEIQKFAEMICKKVAEKLKIRIDSIL
jgi:hypothetical protein